MPRTTDAARRAGMRVTLLALAVVLLLGLVSGSVRTTSTPAEGAAPPPARAGGRVPAPATAAEAVATAVEPPVDRPSFVVVVMDDFSLDLLPALRSAQRMRRTGADYTHAYVVDSLCCPSRAALLTGQPPHLNGVRTNTSGGPGDDLGGWPAFEAGNGPQKSVGVALQRSGYRTGFVGKYLNEYEPSDGGATAPPYVPGWDDFESFSGGAYDGWGFVRTEIVAPGVLGTVRYRTPSLSEPVEVRDDLYAGHVIADRALRLLRRYRAGDDPFFLYVNPYAPHSRLTPAWSEDDPRFPAAFRDRPGVRSPGGRCGPRPCRQWGPDDLDGYGDPVADNRPTYLRGGRTSTAPSWRGAARGTPRKVARTFLRDRARMVQSVDRMVTRILDAAPRDTYVVLTSDNGFHLGQHSLGPGKGTPYDSDTHVPLLVVGPGVEQGPRDQVVSSIDLAPTLEQLAGRRPRQIRGGVGFAASLLDADAPGREAAYVEHTHGPSLPGEPDAPIGSGMRLDAIPSYVGVRTARGLLVRLDLDQSDEGTRYAWELYTYRRSSYERRNSFPRLHKRAWVRDLRRRVVAWADCSPHECRRLASLD